MDTVVLEPEVKDTNILPEGWWKQLIPKDIMTNINYGTKFVIMRAILDMCEKLCDKVQVSIK